MVEIIFTFHSYAGEAKKPQEELNPFPIEVYLVS